MIDDPLAAGGGSYPGIPRDGGPAFPNPSKNAPEDSDALFIRQPGMSLRDYFAAAAVTGLGAYIGRDPSTVALDTAFARLAYGIADAMLAERDKA